MQREVIDKLYGKGNDALQTILNGTHKLSQLWDVTNTLMIC